MKGSPANKDIIDENDEINHSAVFVHALDT